jgi:hypothetical protein
VLPQRLCDSFAGEQVHVSVQLVLVGTRRKVMNEFEQNKEYRAKALAGMRKASATFYGLAAMSGHHAFVEFCGLQQEYIKMCEAAESAGIDWLLASTHTNMALPMELYNIAYLAEKLDCIYGPSLRDPKKREQFVRAFLHVERTP